MKIPATKIIRLKQEKDNYTIFRLLFDDKVIGHHIIQFQNDPATKSLEYYDITLTGTVFNISKGIHKLKVKIGSNSNQIIGKYPITYPDIFLEGDFSSEENAQNLDSFIRPLKNESKYKKNSNYEITLAPQTSKILINGFPKEAYCGLV
eukprot:CAMPEP_0170514010 /NCGR_PEP_ID=MMETSP0209-20121228/568_1 /TAXON_ID=665100 ORGANISM="Litonotus pictus, Strain P1" /NCGR_SAMPLE_ID=MMETSP0209 /ASSEMBLY_ACC=CAM_ASM_000301 /LENGTH=148 /DNA_ID=CAMNT_0010797905 /DNA_START=301 /DNA_END=747 /DNA_ORIENTATION=+